MTPERRQLIIAENELTAQCMRKQGFKHVAVRPPLREMLDPIFVGDDVTSRKNNGYGLSSRRPENTMDGVGLNGKYFNSLSKSEQRRWERAYFGDESSKLTIRMPDGSTAQTNKNGCISEARQTLYGDISKYLRVYMTAVNYPGEAARTIVGDPSYIDATRHWKECMANRGYHYESPDKAQRAAVKFYEGTSDREEARKQEIALATADAECDRQVGLTKLERGLRKRKEEALADKYQADILAYRELEKAALQRAKRLLGPQVLNS